MACSAQQPKCYPYVIYMEHKRFIEAIEEGSGLICSESDEEENQHSPHMDRTKTVHQLAKAVADMMWSSYLENNFDEMLTLYRIDCKHKLYEKTPEERSQLDTYIASLRAFLNTFDKNYIMKIVFSMFGLNQSRDNILVIREAVRMVLKYVESVVSWLERYMSWVQHGADIASAYYNTYNTDEDEEATTAEEFYLDNKVRAYAILKTSDLDSEKLVANIENVDALMYHINILIELGYKLYVDTPVDEFEKVFNALSNTKPKSPNYKGTKFANVHEINEYVREHMRNSIENADGLVFIVTELLDVAKDFYIEKLAIEISDLLTFIPTKKEQEKFIARFESGQLWRHND
jgi:hypothetical protein